MTGISRRERSVSPLPRRERQSTPKSRSRPILLNRLLIVLTTGTFLVLSGLVLFAWSISDEIPELRKIENPDLGLKTIIYSRNNVNVGEIYKENRTNVTYDQLPEHLIHALTATEDRRFFEHSGVDILGFTRAVIKTGMNKVFGIGVQQGGGTISMQTARLLYTGRAGTIKRKLLEMMIAWKLERTYSKQEILEIFFNTMFYGHRSYGLTTAARTYFNKPVNELTIEESAILVGLLQRPSATNPISDPNLSKRRRDMVLYFMYETGHLSRAEKDSLQALPIVLDQFERKTVAPHFRNRLNKELTQLGEELGFSPETDGLQVFTTLDTTVQFAMDSAIRKYIDEIQASSLAKIKTRELRERYLNDSTYVSEEQADSAFQANHLVQYGFITIDHAKGEVLGHIGGRPGSYYDHVFQGVRQPGSLIKPFVYATAIDNGLSPAHKVLDAPYTIVEDTVIWSPKNWDNKTRGLVSMRTALQHSINLAVLHLQDEVGGASAVRSLMRTMGFTTPIKPVPSLPLGVNVVRPIEYVAAFGAFANRGTLVENHTIQKILDKNGNIIFQAAPRRKEVLNEQTAFILTTMLESVVNGGSAGRIRYQSKVPYTIKVASKTGTTNDFTDIWCAAYTPRFTTVVWFGLDNPKHKINLWSSSAVPVIGESIRLIYEANPNWDKREFVMPDGVEKVEICGENNGVFLTNTECPTKIQEYFRSTLKPTEHCKLHTSTARRNKRNIF